MIIPLTNPADPRLDLYRDLRDRVLRKEHGRFILEGWKVFERFMASEHGRRVESVICEPRRVDEVTALLDREVPVYEASAATIKAVASIAIHTGVLGIARRLPERTLGEIARGRVPGALILCPSIKENVNLGALFRTAAGLGASGIVLGPECSDPLYRRAVRVSMGAVFSLPWARSADLRADLDRLREEFGYELFAAELTAGAEPLDRVRRADPTRPFAVVLGHEVEGLGPGYVERCDRRVMIPMHGGIESLNIFVSAAVVLYELAKRR